jgi:hypothetical protein
MKKKYLVVGVTLLGIALLCVVQPRVSGQATPGTETAAPGTDDAYQQALKDYAAKAKRQDEQMQRGKALLMRQEDYMKRLGEHLKVQEELHKRFGKILDTWEKQQQQYQRHLDTLPKK